VSARRGSTDLAGLLVIDKPAGMTSHDVVGAVRRSMGERRVGHAGTLDPAATGVLLVLVGPFTRLERYLSGKTKSYDAVIAFGAETDTDDAEGTITTTAPVSPDLLTKNRARQILAGFLGDQSQQPPVYSAIKRDGQTAHRVARAGGQIELEPRNITVLDADLVSIDPEAATWTVSFTVSKGTYIRALARDIGRRAGSRAHLAGLRRSASGPVTLESAHALETVIAAEDVRALFADPIAALGMPVLEVDPAGLAAVANGRPLGQADIPDGQTAIVFNDRLLAIYCARDGRLLPETVLGAQT